MNSLGLPAFDVPFCESRRRLRPCAGPTARARTRARVRAQSLRRTCPSRDPCHIALAPISSAAHTLCYWGSQVSPERWLRHTYARFYKPQLSTCKLYQAPVESDTASKPAAEKSAAHARSSIRRGRLRTVEQIREHRRRRIQDAVASGPPGRVVVSANLANGAASAPAAESNTASAAPGAGDGGTRDAISSHLFAPQARSESAPDVVEQGRQAFRDLASRMAINENEAMVIFSDQWYRLRDHDRTADDVGGRGDGRSGENHPSRSTRFWSAAFEPFALSNVRSTQNSSAAQSPHHHRSSQDPIRRLGRTRSSLLRDESTLGIESDVRSRINENSARSLNSPDQDDMRDSTRRSAGGSRSADLERAQLMDGLGDRNRSLSPESDSIWDTLLAHIEPDPHTSSGSSFASTTASASATTAAGTGTSSRTSFAGPDMLGQVGDSTGRQNALALALNDLRDLPYDDSDSDGHDEDDDGDGQRNMPRSAYFRRVTTSSRPRRSYAHVITDGADDGVLTSAAAAAAAAAGAGSGNGTANGSSSANEWGDEILGGLAGMQRIVRNLAQRHEIPDEWWAEAGLSRNLTRDNMPGN